MPAAFVIKVQDSEKQKPQMAGFKCIGQINHFNEKLGCRTTCQTSHALFVPNILCPENENNKLMTGF